MASGNPEINVSAALHKPHTNTRQGNKVARATGASVRTVRCRSRRRRARVPDPAGPGGAPGTHESGMAAELRLSLEEGLADIRADRDRMPTPSPRSTARSQAACWSEARPVGRAGQPGPGHGAQRPVAGHRTYLTPGGRGLFVGDGRLDYRPETVFEVFHNLQLAKAAWITLDWEHIHNPAYNADRGPVNVMSARLHTEF